MCRNTFALTYLLAVSMSGCAAFKDRATEYLTQTAVEQVQKAVDGQLEKRGLSLVQLKSLADTDRSGKVSAGEIANLAKAAVGDVVSLKVGQAADKAQVELEKKLTALADVKDLDQLKAAAADQGLLTKSTLLGLLTMLGGYLTKQVFSAKSDGKRDERLAVLEQMLNKDLDGDGVVGRPIVVTAAPVQPAAAPG